MDDRYKKRGLQFNSALDARALRAVQRQQHQKVRRSNAVNSRRQIDHLEDSLQVDQSFQTENLLASSSKISLKERRYQLGMQRYQLMLKWKEQKKNHLEKEKRRRLPSFKTGIFQPDAAKYLISDDGTTRMKQTPGKMTPLGASRKNVMTPGASFRRAPVFHTGGTPASLYRVPQFHTGLTPCEGIKKSTVLPSRTRRDQENMGCASRTRTNKRIMNIEGMKKGGNNIAARGRITRQRKLAEQEDLGVKPLPVTPLPAQGSPISRRRNIRATVQPPQRPMQPSFAPENFAFNFEAPKPSISLAQKSSIVSSPDDPQSAHFHENMSDQTDLPQSLPEKSSEDKEEGVDSASFVFIESNESVVEEKAAETIKSATLSEELNIKEADNEKDDTGFHGDWDLQSGSKNTSTTLTCQLHADEVQSYHDKEVKLKTSNDNQQEDVANVIGENGGHKCKGGSLEETEKERVCFVNVDQSIVESGGEAVENEELTSGDTYICDDVSKEDTKSFSKSRRSTSVVTPAKRITRRSASCCYSNLDLVTPTLSRLRPRTPCSRSTRRSLSAHCDTPYELYTPTRKASARKRSYAANNETKLSNSDELPKFDVPPAVRQEKAVSESPQGNVMAVACEELNPRLSRDAGVQSSLQTPAPNDSNLTSKQAVQRANVLKDSSPLMTPENVRRQALGLWTVDTSPWVEHSRRKKKKQSLSNDLQGMFDDIPTDGSPIPAHLLPSNSGHSPHPPPVAKNTPGIKENACEDVCTKLLPLLQPSQAQDTASPDVNVWGEESPAIPSTTATPKTSRPIQPHLPLTLQEGVSLEQSNITKDGAKDSPLPLQGNASILLPTITTTITAAEDCPKGWNKGEKRRSRKSVMFVIEEQENVNSETYRIPGTPIRASSRASMGLFSKVDENVDDLIALDHGRESPKSEKKTVSTRRKSCRVSLLPGMTLSPKSVRESPITDDLMTWDTPPQSKKSSDLSASSLVTPLRRSRRLSKALVV